MALLGFKPQFVDPILDGTKHGTIRAYRKYPIKVGETLYLYTGLRTKHCKKITEKQCLTVVPIRLHFVKRTVHIYSAKKKRWFLLYSAKTPNALNLFARGDGFPDFAAMCGFWKDTVLFEGAWILWKNDRHHPLTP